MSQAYKNPWNEPIFQWSLLVCVIAAIVIIFVAFLHTTYFSYPTLRYALCIECESFFKLVHEDNAQVSVSVSNPMQPHVIHRVNGASAAVPGHVDAHADARTHADPTAPAPCSRRQPSMTIADAHADGAEESRC